MIFHVTRLVRTGSRSFYVVSAVVFAVMLTVLLTWKHPVQEEKMLEKKLAEGRRVRTDLLVPVWLRKGWVAGTGLAGLVVLGSPWFARRRNSAMRFCSMPQSGPLGWAQVAGCAGLTDPGRRGR